MSLKLYESAVSSIKTIASASEKHHGLFPSILDCHSGQMPDMLPPNIPGQRNGDRAHPGCNLIHDEPLLKTMYALSELEGDDYFCRVADRYIQYFAHNCTDTPTGLFPWGEHSFWNFRREDIGNSYSLKNPQRDGESAIHDHLRQVPFWLWEKIDSFNPEAVQRFADGLDFHWTGPEREEYKRHAYIEKKEYAEPYLGSRDFPRHSGFYIFDWSFACSRQGRPEIFQQIWDIMDHWWYKRDKRGLLRMESRSPEGDLHFDPDSNTATQTLSLGISLFDSAALIEKQKPKLAETMRRRARTYIQGFLNAPHRPEKHIFVSMCSRSTNELLSTMSIWGSKYGSGICAGPALICLSGWRYTHNEELLQWSRAVLEAYREEEFPKDLHVPASDVGLVLELFCDFYDITGEKAWLDEGLHLAENIVPLYLEGRVPRGALNIDWYESQMGPAFLIHSLARLYSLHQGPDSCPLSTNYTAR